MQKTPIEWTTYTSNPIRARHRETGKMGWACTRISPGCQHCYAESLNKRLGTGLMYDKAAEDQVEWVLNEDELQAILRHRKPGKVFLGDMTDVFHERVPDAWLDKIFAVMAQSPHLTFQLLTKRAERMHQYMATIRPLPNIWLGVSTEDQPRADERIPWLLGTPASVRFLSVEPMLGAINLTQVAPHRYGATHALKGYTTDVTDNIGALRIHEHPNQRIEWVIVGGESGPNARPCHLAWVRSIVEQCQAASIPCFVKQLGRYPVIEAATSLGSEVIRQQVQIDAEWPVGTHFGNPTGLPELNGRVALLKDRKGGDPMEWPEDLRVREMPDVTS